MGTNHKNGFINVMCPYGALCYCYWYVEILFSLCDTCRGLISYCWPCVYKFGYFLLGRNCLSLGLYGIYIILFAYPILIVHDYTEVICGLFIEWILAHMHMYLLDLKFSFLFFCKHYILISYIHS